MDARFSSKKRCGPPHPNRRPGRRSKLAPVKALSRLWHIWFRPRQTARELLADPALSPALAVVVGFGALMSLLLVRSHLAGAYPPPPDVLATWVDAWGELAMLPLVKIPPEHYRLALAIGFIPLSLAAWILMAGSAALLSIAFRGRLGFAEYLRLFAFSFFPAWIAASAIDAVFSGPLAPSVLSALRGEHGPGVRQLVIAFPMVVYPAVLGLGAVYNAIAAFEGERFGILRSAAIGAASAAWPIALTALLLR